MVDRWEKLCLLRIVIFLIMKFVNRLVVILFVIVFCKLGWGENRFFFYNLWIFFIYFYSFKGGKLLNISKVEGRVFKIEVRNLEWLDIIRYEVLWDLFVGNFFLGKEFRKFFKEIDWVSCGSLSFLISLVFRSWIRRFVLRVRIVWDE